MPRLQMMPTTSSLQNFFTLRFRSRTTGSSSNDSSGGGEPSNRRQNASNVDDAEGNKYDDVDDKKDGGAEFVAGGAPPAGYELMSQTRCLALANYGGFCFVGFAIWWFATSVPRAAFPDQSTFHKLENRLASLYATRVDDNTEKASTTSIAPSLALHHLVEGSVIPLPAFCSARAKSDTEEAFRRDGDDIDRREIPDPHVVVAEQTARAVNAVLAGDGNADQMTLQSPFHVRQLNRGEVDELRSTTMRSSSKTPSMADASGGGEGNYDLCLSVAEEDKWARNLSGGIGVHTNTTESLFDHFEIYVHVSSIRKHPALYVSSEFLSALLIIPLDANITDDDLIPELRMIFQRTWFRVPPLASRLSFATEFIFSFLLIGDGDVKLSWPFRDKIRATLLAPFLKSFSSIFPLRLSSQVIQRGELSQVCRDSPFPTFLDREGAPQRQLDQSFEKIRHDYDDDDEDNNNGSERRKWRLKEDSEPQRRRTTHQQQLVINHHEGRNISDVGEGGETGGTTLGTSQDSESRERLHDVNGAEGKLSSSVPPPPTSSTSSGVDELKSHGHDNQPRKGFGDDEVDLRDGGGEDRLINDNQDDANDAESRHSNFFDNDDRDGMQFMTPESLSEFLKVSGTWDAGEWVSEGTQKPPPVVNFALYLPSRKRTHIVDSRGRDVGRGFSVSSWGTVAIASRPLSSMIEVDASDEGDKRITHSPTDEQMLDAASHWVSAVRQSLNLPPDNIIDHLQHDSHDHFLGHLNEHVNHTDDDGGDSDNEEWRRSPSSSMRTSSASDRPPSSSSSAPSCCRQIDVLMQSPRRAGIASWEVAVLQRRYVAEYLSRAIMNLKRAVGVLAGMSDLVVHVEVSRRIEICSRQISDVLTWIELRRRRQQGDRNQNGNEDDDGAEHDAQLSILRLSAEAYKSSVETLHDGSTMADVYFDYNMKHAVYSPLMIPFVLPVMVNALREILFRRRMRTAASRTSAN